MTDPQPTFVDALRAAFAGAGDVRNLLLNTRAPASQSFTPDEAMGIVEKWAHALNDLPRYPISMDVTRQPDGRMTITVTPHNA